MSQRFIGGTLAQGNSVFGLSDEQLELALLRRQQFGQSLSSNKGRVEFILIRSSHQPFALLMSQIYNIVRPGPDGIEVLRQPNLKHNRSWGEVLYQGSAIRVMELPVMLKLPLVEPIQRSRVLLSGTFRPDGGIEAPFGVAIEDVLAVKSVSYDDIRLLPKWLARNLNGLLWGVVLMDRETLAKEGALEIIKNEAQLEPLSFAEYAENPEDLLRIALAEPEVLLDSDGNISADRSPVYNNEQLLHELRFSGKFVHVQQDERRPVMILNLDALKRVIYQEEEA